MKSTPLSVSSVHRKIKKKAAQPKLVLSGNVSMHTGQRGVKGGSKPQPTPHPSYAHKNSMSSSPPSLPHAVPLLLPLSLLLLLCAPSLEMNHLILRGFCFFCIPSVALQSEKSPFQSYFLLLSSIYLHTETQDSCIKQLQ